MIFRLGYMCPFGEMDFLSGNGVENTIVFGFSANGTLDGFNDPVPVEIQRIPALCRPHCLASFTLAKCPNLRPAGIPPATRLPEEIRFLLTPLFELHGGLRGAETSCIHSRVFALPAADTPLKIALLLGGFVFRQRLAVIGAGLALIFFEDIIGVGRFVAGEEGVVRMAAVPSTQSSAGAVSSPGGQSGIARCLTVSGKHLALP